MTWYRDAHSTAAAIGSTNGLTTNVVAGIIAALSPGCSWSKNVEYGRTFAAAFSAGRRGKRLPLVGTYGWRNMRKAESIARGADPLEVFGSPRSLKVKSFYIGLANPLDTTSVCIDRHAKSAALGYRLLDEDATVGVGDYKRIAKHFIRGAAIHGILPNQYQGVIWVVWRRTKGVLTHENYQALAA